MRKLNRFQISALLNFGKGAIEEIISEEAAKGNRSHEFSSAVLGSDYIIYFDENGEILAVFDKEEDNCENTAEDYINYLKAHDANYNYILNEKDKKEINQFLHDCDHGLRGDYLNCWAALNSYYLTKMAMLFTEKAEDLNSEDHNLYIALRDEYNKKLIDNLREFTLKKGGDR